MTMRGIALIAAVAVLTVASGCRRDEPQPRAPQLTPPSKASGAPAAPAPVGQPDTRDASRAVQDAAISARLKAAYAAASDVSAMEINVTTVDGVVHLKGFVSDTAHIARAEEIARGMEGVREVQNGLTVRSTKR
jgi:hyperosmotically inducible periplasmic protein